MGRAAAAVNVESRSVSADLCGVFFFHRAVFCAGDGGPQRAVLFYGLSADDRRLLFFQSEFGALLSGVSRRHVQYKICTAGGMGKIYLLDPDRGGVPQVGSGGDPVLFSRLPKLEKMAYAVSGGGMRKPLAFPGFLQKDHILFLSFLRGLHVRYRGDLPDQHREMRGGSCAVADLLQSGNRGRQEEPVLFLLQSGSAGAVCVRLIYPGDIPDRVLPEYHQYFSDTGDCREDTGEEAADPVDSVGRGGISGVFCVVFAERVQYGYQAVAVQELDISVEAG